jgi:chloramphenicol 3-O phosphotransferase
VIVVLNGAPRSGKSSIAAALQETGDGTWMNVGVDVARLMTPPRDRPGIGLRPGEPEPPLLRVLYAALWESVAAHARLGLNVAVDVGVHQADVVEDAERRLAGLQLLRVGVRCPVGTILERRRATGYPDEPELAERWERAVHAHWSYDLEVDTSTSTAADCAATILTRLATVLP